MLIRSTDQVGRDEGLLDTAKDYFHFVTRFFEPINVSAAHIYHSALELSPLSSIVRRLYYHRRHTPFPRVVAGTADSWDQVIHLQVCGDDYKSCTWSPCGRFVATITCGRVQIRDALSSELVSTLTEYASSPERLAYSPDGCFLASLSDTLIIWDIQTGGAVEDSQCSGGVYGDSIVWSLDGKTIGMTAGLTVYLYDVTSGATRSSRLQSMDELRLWAHGESFRVMATGREGRVLTIEISDIGSDLAKIESFRIKTLGQIESFSPTTYRISVFVHDRLQIFDIRNSECLLEEDQDQESEDFHAFSSDGSLFAASLDDGICIWRYTSGCYTLWKEFLGLSWSFDPFPLHFSPTSLSILTRTREHIQVYPLNSPPILAHPDDSMPFVILSPCGMYIATARRRGHTVTITNLLSKTTPQFIDTDMEICDLALTGTILLVFGSVTARVAAWRLTEGGMVDGIFGDRRADDGDGIWVAWGHVMFTKFTVKDQAVVFECMGHIHAYHTGTGEALDPTQVHPRDPGHYPPDMSLGRHYPNYRRAGEQGHSPEDDWPAPLVAPDVVWVKDPEGKHRLWIPPEWRAYHGGWLHDIRALWLYFGENPVVIIML